MYRFTFFVIPALLMCILTTMAQAGTILMIGPSPSELFTNAGLSQYGHTIVNGPSYNAFDGSIDLSSYDVVILSAVFYALPDMPLAGQQSIVNFVTNGGGLITGEWVTWRHAATGAFSQIVPLLPATTDGSYIGGAGVGVSVRYEQVTPDPVINAGLPTRMEFVVDAAGSEIITPKPGATVFYSGDSISPFYIYEFGVGHPVDGVFPSAGLVGWDYGNGRVLSFSTTMQQPIGPDYSDNYSRLVSNSIDWAANGTVVPEPASLAVWGIWTLGVSGLRRRR